MQSKVYDDNMESIVITFIPNFCKLTKHLYCDLYVYFDDTFFVFEIPNWGIS